MHHHLHHEPLILLSKYLIPFEIIEHHFARAHGHGGQNVNKVETKVQLRVEIQKLPLPVELLQKLLRKFPHGHIEVCDQTTRHQHENYELALKKLQHVLEENLK